MNENIEIQKLEQIKYSLIEKQKIILNSQIKQSKLENELKILETKRNNILNNKKSILSKVTALIIYDIIILLIILSFVLGIINNLILTPISIKSIYIGVLSISVIGAMLSSKIEEKRNKYCKKKKLNILSNKIKEKEEEIEIEINKQESIRKEIIEIIYYLDNITPEVPLSNQNYINNARGENNQSFQTIEKKGKAHILSKLNNLP